MHEMMFTEQIVEAIVAQLKKQPAGRAKKIRVLVGEMFHLHKDAVLMHYELLTKDTELEGMAIELKEEPVTIECNQCRHAGYVQDHHLLMCSQCDSRDVKVLSGNQIFAEFIET